jgi:hypothetical protein
MHVLFTFYLLDQIFKINICIRIFVYFFLNSYQVENDLDSFIQTARLKRTQSLMANTPRSNSLYVPRSNFSSQSDANFYKSPSETNLVNPEIIRSLSPDDVQKMKYKIDLG